MAVVIGKIWRRERAYMLVRFGETLRDSKMVVANNQRRGCGREITNDDVP